jgi:hypothetical protein
VNCFQFGKFHRAERKQKANGKCEGRKSLAEMYPGVVREAKRLARANPKTGERWCLRRIAAELAKIGRTLADTGTPGTEETVRPSCDGTTIFGRPATSPPFRDFVHCRFADAGRRWVWLRYPTAGIRNPLQIRASDGVRGDVSSTSES